LDASSEQSNSIRKIPKWIEVPEGFCQNSQNPGRSMEMLITTARAEKGIQVYRRTIDPASDVKALHDADDA